ncbi:hypothetical protein JW796_02965 [Candidatus Dojkabacteria bacterium]|nr:hypothetical protein [Candidatus Dojkabacteria bacterium]
MAHEKGYTYKRKDLGKLRVELEVEVSGERFKEEKNHIYGQLAKTVEISGFRKGNAPKNLVEAKLGAKLFEETINHLLPEVTVEIIGEEKFTPITRVEYKVAKVSDDGLSYSAFFSLYPEIKLGDFKKIKLEKQSDEVKGDEVEKVVKQMFEEHQKRAEEKTGKSDKGDSRATSIAKIEKGKKGKEKKKELEMNDEWAKKTNMGVESIKDLKEKVKEQLRHLKTRNNREKYISDLVLEAVNISNIDLPEVLVDQELDRREADYKGRIENLGLKLEDYLKGQKVTMEDLRKQWKEDAVKKVKVELLLVEISRQNQFKIEDLEVEKELASIQDKNTKEYYSSEKGRNYIRSVILQQKAINYLLDIVEPKDASKANQVQ